MAVNNDGNPAKHFGRQMKKERIARGWTLREFSAHTGVGIGYASQIENGKRPPTERVARACDTVFPERRGWFTEYYAELSTWSEVPPAFKDWREREDRAMRLYVWMPGIIHGLLQAEDYARSLLETYPGVGFGSTYEKVGGIMGNWRKSSYSGANGGSCVEVAAVADGVAVRDTADRSGGTLSVPASTWTAFVRGLAKLGTGRVASTQTVLPEREPFFADGAALATPMR